jgi:8-oxo-dGTP diphosphatase
VTVFLVRHAHAGKRSQWDGDDALRPLSRRGRAQALAVADLLEGHAVGRVVSSPSARCLQTVEPVAGAHDIAVEVDERLAEGADPDAAVALLLELADVHGVACSHGDLIPVALRRLVAMGMQVEGALLDQKGSVWSIDVEDGRPVRGGYTPPSV